jgi:hypothetical protein
VSKIKYKDASGYKYQTVERAVFKTPIINAAAMIPGFVELLQDGTLTVFPGYAWDGASGPTIDTKSSMRASLVHDAFYQLMRAGKLGQEWRGVVDQVLYQLCVADGMWKLRAKTWLWALRSFAGHAAKRKAEAVMVAP